VRRIVVVTGANRGIGLEVVRQLAAAGDTVVLGSRDLERGEAAAATITSGRDSVLVRALDVTAEETLAAIAAELDTSFGRLDVLVNNAAIHYDTWQRPASADLGIVEEAWATNVVGAWRAVQVFLPLLRASGHGRIVNVSSESGALASMGNETPAYSVSKAALNALTKQLAADLRGDHILVNSVCPGWVATDMGGPGGRPVRDGAASILWAVDLPDSGPTGDFFRDGQPVPF
jgi:NAD(P)-dependent dehydrogenase (short-subunit alcohol dehydrogenase family)